MKLTSLRKLAGFSLLAAFAWTNSCRAYDVYIGGFTKQDQLLDRSTWAFVADHCGGYFNHPDALRHLTLAQRRQIAGNFLHKDVIQEANNHRAVSGWTAAPAPAHPEAQSLAAAGFVPSGAFIAAGGCPTLEWQNLARG